MTQLRSGIWALAFASLAFGCGAGQLVQPNRVPDADVAGATGRAKVKMVQADRPLIVDWKPEQRVDLEVAMRQGVAVVQYDGARLSLLADCTVEGEYRFYGVTQKTEIIRLESQAEVKANLPLGGAGLVTNLGGELGTGSTLDLALVIIGKSRTTWSSPTPADLKGRCEGATHFVRGAVLGAFAMSMGKQSMASTAVEIFGDGVKGNASAGAGIQRSDGMMAACQQADPDHPKPPKQCRALIRLELFPIAKKAQKMSASPERLVRKCGVGFVLSGGKCVVSAAQTAAEVCSFTILRGCSALCKKGDGAACFKLAYAQVSGKGGRSADWEKASTLVTRSCRLGHPDGCLLYADFFMKEGKLDKAVAAYNQACRMGHPLGCFSAGSMFAAGEGTARDPRRAAALNRRGCDGGAQEACVALAAQYAGGVGVKADQNESLALNQRACDGDNARACGNVGLHYELGIKRARDQTKAARLYRRACTLDKASCLRLGILRESGGSSNQKAAREAFGRACSQPDTPFGALACGHLNRFYGRRGPVNIARVGEVEKALAPQCGQKLSRACGLIGAALGVKGDPRAPKFLAAACRLGDGWACGMVRRTSGQRK